MQQVFFVDDVENLEWKIVLRKEARGARVTSSAERRLETLSLVLGRDEDYRGLRSNILNEDVQPHAPMLQSCIIVETQDVHVAMQKKMKSKIIVKTNFSVVFGDVFICSQP